MTDTMKKIKSVTVKDRSGEPLSIMDINYIQSILPAHIKMCIEFDKIEIVDSVPFPCTSEYEDQAMSYMKEKGII